MTLKKKQKKTSEIERSVDTTGRNVATITSVNNCRDTSDGHRQKYICPNLDTALRENCTYGIMLCDMIY